MKTDMASIVRLDLVSCIAETSYRILSLTGEHLPEMPEGFWNEIKALDIFLCEAVWEGPSNDKAP